MLGVATLLLPVEITTAVVQAAWVSSLLVRI